MGPSGSGKSTLLQLLLRFYPLDGGSICVGGVDLHALPNAWLRAHFGVVPQEPTW